MLIKVRYLLKYILKKIFESFGVHVENIEKGNQQVKDTKTISLRIGFDKAYTGTLILTAYDNERNELGTGEVLVEKRAGEISNINFQMPGNLNLSFIKYCMLENKSGTPSKSYDI